MAGVKLQVTDIKHYTVICHIDDFCGKPIYLVLNTEIVK